MINTDLTYKILAYKAIKDFNTDECIDWAIKLLELGYETPSLLILAGLDRPTNYFEAINYLEKTLKELDIKPKENEDAIISYCYFYIKQISNRINVKNNLAIVCKFCSDYDYEKNIYNFYLLNWAWDDFNYSDTTHYWNGATKDNIEDLVIQISKDWILQFQDKIKI
jgi:hypothetical protein